MIVRFDIDMNDVLAYQRHYLKTDRTIRKKVTIVRWFFPLIWLILLIPLYTNGRQLSGRDAAFSATLILFAVVWFALYPRLVAGLSMRRARKIYSRPENAIYFGTVEITFDEHGFKVAKPNNEGQYAWNTIVKVNETEDHIFVYISGIAANIIPKRKISPDQMDELKSFFTKYVTNKS